MALTERTSTGRRPANLSGGRTMKGWILVQPKGLATDAALGKWVGIGLEYAAGLPPKKGTKKA